jgi:GST-like protein
MCQPGRVAGESIRVSSAIAALHAQHLAPAYGEAPREATSCRASLAYDAGTAHGTRATNRGENSDVIDLYTASTGNGQRPAIAMEEAGLAYRVHKINLAKGEQRAPDFLKLNPSAAIPVIVDGDGPGGKPITIAQSGAIILYVAEKTGKFMPKDPARRAAALQWLMQAASDCSGSSSALFAVSARLLEKTPATVDFLEQRLLKYFGDCDQRLQGRPFLADEFSVADLALYPVCASRRALIDKAPGLADLKRWMAAMAARPAIAKGMQAAS